MKKRILGILLAGILVVSALTACAGNGDETTTTDTPTADTTDGDEQVEGTEGAGGEEAPPLDTDGRNFPVDENGNPDPFGRYQEPITLEIVMSVDPTTELPEGDTVTDHFWTRYIKEHLNINIEVKWQAAPADFRERIGLAIAANDLPDIMVVNRQEFAVLVQNDMIADLTDYFEAFSSQIVLDNIASTEGRAMDAVTVDGRIMGLPNVAVEADSFNLMWIRQDWLNELGLEPPTTMAELEVVAQAFIDNEMGGPNTIGILGPTINAPMYNHFLASQNNMYTLDGIFQAFNAFPGFWLEDENGDIIYGSTTAETREALGELQRLFAAGILDQELGVRRDAPEAWRSGQAGILFGQWWFGYLIQGGIAIDPNAEWRAFTAPLNDEGYFSSKMGSVGDHIVVVRRDFEHPEAILVMNNLLRRDEGLFSEMTTLPIGFWPGRVVIVSLDECDISVEFLRKYMRGEEIPEFDAIDYKLLENDLATISQTLLDFDDLSIHNWNTDDGNFGRIYSLLIGHAPVVDADAAGIVRRVYSAIYHQTPIMERRWANLQTIEEEVFLRIIIGELELDEFDAFVERWYAEGGREITDEVREVLGR